MGMLQATKAERRNGGRTNSPDSGCLPFMKLQSPQQLLIDGNPVTDMEPQVAVAYGTRETDWLSVEFDATGSWRASIIGAELPRGIHGAVVQVSRGESRVDVPVSVLVN